MTLGEIEERIKQMYADGFEPEDSLVVKAIDVTGIPIYYERMDFYSDPRDGVGVIEIEG